MPTRRVLYYDLLNISACFAVIALHCNQMVHTWQPGINWLVALGIEVFFYWAVPIFFMLTGATLMQYRERYDTKTFLVKRFKRTVIPFIAWSFIFYLLISVPLQGQHLGIRTFLNLMLNNGIEQVYWFFPPLFSIYLSMPLISLLSNYKKTIAYGIGVAFLLQSILPFLLPVIGISWSNTLSIPAFTGMLMYVGLGYLLSNTDLSAKHRRLIYITGVMAMAFRYAYTAISSQSLGYLDRTFFSYSAFPAVLQAIAVFVLFKQLEQRHFIKLQPNKTTRFQKLISTASACSFGIYLIHKPILDHIVIGVLGVPLTSPPLRTIGVLFLYLFCLSLVFIAKRFKVGRILLP